MIAILICKLEPVHPLRRLCLLGLLLIMPHLLRKRVGRPTKRLWRSSISRTPARRGSTKLQCRCRLRSRSCSNSVVVLRSSVWLRLILELRCLLLGWQIVAVWLPIRVWLLSTICWLWSSWRPSKGVGLVVRLYRV